MSGATSRQPPADPLLGRTVHDRYRVLRRIGEGSMGVVYEVEHTVIGRRFALKTLQPAAANRIDVIKRFHREARAAATVGHEGIVSVTDMGVLDDGTPFLVMELLEGSSVGEELARLGPFTVARALAIILACSEALGAAHDRGVVHRDIKPDNIFLGQAAGRREQVKIVDFGISRIREAMDRADSYTQAGSMLGTPYYMSPEQFEGRTDVDGRADVYGLGVVLFQLLTGRLPYEATNLPLLMMAVCKGPPPSPRALAPGIPEDLDAVVRTAMAVQREQRFATMGALRAALLPIYERYAGDEGGLAAHTSVDEDAHAESPAPEGAPGVPAWLDEPTEHDPDAVRRAVQSLPPATAEDPLGERTLPDDEPGGLPATLAGAPPPVALGPTPPAPPPAGSRWSEPTEHGLRRAGPPRPQAPAARRSLPLSAWIGIALIAVALAGIVVLALR